MSHTNLPEEEVVVLDGDVPCCGRCDGEGEMLIRFRIPWTNPGSKDGNGIIKWVLCSHCDVHAASELLQEVDDGRVPTAQSLNLLLDHIRRSMWAAESDTGMQGADEDDDVVINMPLGGASLLGKQGSGVSWPTHYDGLTDRQPSTIARSCPGKTST